MNEVQRPSAVVDPVAVSEIVLARSEEQESNGPTQVGGDKDERVARQQEAFLLRQLLEATPHHQLRLGEANKKLKNAFPRTLGLERAIAQRVRERLASHGYVQISKVSRTIEFELTDAGREYLQTLGAYSPAVPEDEAVDEAIAGYQKAHLLLQLLGTPKVVLTKGEANKKKELGPTDLELKPMRANRLRRELAQKGWIKITASARTEAYELTGEGEAALATLRFYPHGELKMKGERLNHLLELASARGEKQEGSSPDASFVSAPVDLGAAVYDAFEELRRERYGHSNLVPIYMIRHLIGEKYGPKLARHDVLDEPIRELARHDKVRLVAISDPRSATSEQLADSIPGLEQTFFYLGVVHG